MARKATSRNEERATARDSFPVPYVNNPVMINDSFMNYESSGMGFQNIGIGWRKGANPDFDPRPDDLVHIADQNAGGPGNGSPRKDQSNK